MWLPALCSSATVAFASAARTMGRGARSTPGQAEIMRHRRDYPPDGTIPVDPLMPSDAQRHAVRQWRQQQGHSQRHAPPAAALMQDNMGEVPSSHHPEATLRRHGSRRAGTGTGGVGESRAFRGFEAEMQKLHARFGDAPAAYPSDHFDNHYSHEAGGGEGIAAGQGRGRMRSPREFFQGSAYRGSGSRHAERPSSAGFRGGVPKPNLRPALVSLGAAVDGAPKGVAPPGMVLLGELDEY